MSPFQRLSTSSAVHAVQNTSKLVPTSSYLNMVVGGVHCTRAAVVGSSYSADVALVDHLFVGSSYTAFLGDACLAHTENSDLTSNATNGQMRSFCGSIRCSFHIVRSFTQVFPSLPPERYLVPSRLNAAPGLHFLRFIGPKNGVHWSIFGLFVLILFKRFPSGSFSYVAHRL